MKRPGGAQASPGIFMGRSRPSGLRVACAPRRGQDDPMVVLNHAIATAMVHGPAAGLERLTALDTDARISGHHRLDAVRAHLLEMTGDHERAALHYRAAAERTTSIPERNYLITRAARLNARPG